MVVKFSLMLFFLFFNLAPMALAIEGIPRMVSTLRNDFPRHSRLADLAVYQDGQAIRSELIKYENQFYTLTTDQHVFTCFHIKFTDQFNQPVVGLADFDRCKENENLNDLEFTYIEEISIGHERRVQVEYNADLRLVKVRIRNNVIDSGKTTITEYVVTSL